MLPVSRHSPWVTTLFAVTLIVALGFTAHAIYMLATRWMDPAPAAVEGWMTPRLVVLSFGLRPDALSTVLGVSEDDTPFMTLDDLAAERGIAPQVLIAEIKRAVAAAGATP